MNRKCQSVPIALTIAGSDSGGGAGVQADLKTFAALGIHGTCAITCITAQNPKAILAIEPVPAGIVELQLEALFAELRPAAIKTGLLCTRETIRVVADFYSRRHRRPPLIVDPVMVATSGRVLLKSSAIQALREQLLPLATLVTPNLDEAEMLVGRKLASLDDLRSAAQKIHARFGCAALVKGGHLHRSSVATDVLFDGKTLQEFTLPRVRGVITHGTGCTYSAAITALLAQGHALPEAVALAKRFVTRAITHSQLACGHAVLNWDQGGLAARRRLGALSAKRNKA